MQLICTVLKEELSVYKPFYKFKATHDSSLRIPTLSFTKEIYLEIIDPPQKHEFDLLFCLINMVIGNWVPNTFLRDTSELGLVASQYVLLQTRK